MVSQGYVRSTDRSLSPSPASSRQYRDHSPGPKPPRVLWNPFTGKDINLWYQNAGFICKWLTIIILMLGTFIMTICTGIMFAFFATSADYHILSQTGNAIGQSLIQLLLSSKEAAHVAKQITHYMGELIVKSTYALF